MFAFALWDGRREPVLARDRLGKKPLFYSDPGRHRRFASELLGPAPGRGHPSDVDHRALRRYYAYIYVPAP